MRQTGSRAFTLIELLVVIGIIAVLVAIGFTAATTVLAGGRSQATQSTILAIEGVQQALSAETDLRPKDYKEYRATIGGGEVWFPIIDARPTQVSVDRSSRAVPSLGRFLKFAAETVPEIESRWNQLDPSLIRVGDIGNSASFGPSGGRSDELIGTEILDSWGNPIRFVHPSFDGGAGEWYDSQGMSNSRDPIEARAGRSAGTGGPAPREFRRSFRPYDPDDPDEADAIGDADEGICPGGTGGYLYSAGPDGDPGTRADNVYGSVEPEFPSETEGQN